MAVEGRRRGERESEDGGRMRESEGARTQGGMIWQEGWVAVRGGGMEREGRDPERLPSRHLVDTRAPNSHEIQQKMAVPNTGRHGAFPR